MFSKDSAEQKQEAIQEKEPRIKASGFLHAIVKDLVDNKGLKLTEVAAIGGVEFKTVRSIYRNKKVPLSFFEIEQFYKNLICNQQIDTVSMAADEGHYYQAILDIDNIQNTFNRASVKDPVSSLNYITLMGVVLHNIFVFEAIPSSITVDDNLSVIITHHFLKSKSHLVERLNNICIYNESFEFYNSYQSSLKLTNASTKEILKELKKLTNNFN